MYDVFGQATHLAEREQDSLEKCGGLVKRLFERFVEMHVQFTPVFPHILTTSVEQNTLEENSDLCWLQIGNEDLGTGERGVWGPFCRLGERQQLCPVRKGWKDLEGFWERTRFVS